MPKTAMHEYDLATRTEDNIGLSWEVLAVKSISVAEAV